MKCKGITKAGLPCNSRARTGEEYCRFHYDQAPVTEPTTNTPVAEATTAVLDVRDCKPKAANSVALPTFEAEPERKPWWKRLFG